MHGKLRALSLSLAVTLTLALSPTYAAAVEFSDVPPSYWAYEYIARAADDGAVNGYSNGEFRPTATVTLAHFIAMLARTIYADDLASLEADASAPWYAAAQDVGQIHDLFWEIDPDMNAPLSRYAMATVLFSVLVDIDPDWDVSDEELSDICGSIADFDDFPSYVLQQVTPVIYATGILTGYSDGSFRGDATLTRAAAAAVYCRLKDFIALYGYDEEASEDGGDDLIERMRQEALDDVNELRAEQGLPPMQLSYALNLVAQIRAMEILTNPSDTRPDGSDWRTVFSELGVSCGRAGEFFFALSDDDSDDPPELLELILDPEYTQLGIGFSLNDDVIYLLIVCADGVSVSDAPDGDPNPVPPDDGSGVWVTPDNLLDSLNALRAAQGLGPLSLSTELSAAAKIRAEEFQRGYNQVRPDGREWHTVMDDVGLTDFGVVGEVFNELDPDGDALPGNFQRAALDEDYNYVGFGSVTTDSGKLLLALVLTMYVEEE